MTIPQIYIEKHISPDNPTGQTEYYVIVVDGQAQPIYASKDLEVCEARFDHIQEIGYKAYMEEIRITKEVVKQADFNCPEYIEAVKEAEEKRKADFTIKDDGELVEGEIEESKQTNYENKI